MGILDTLFGSGAAGVGTLVEKVVGTFHLSPEAKMEFEKQLEEHKFELAKIDAQLEEKYVEAASGNIQAEAKSGDKYTSRARPTFLYICEGILAWNYIAVPIWHQVPVALPDALFWLFGSCMLGYTSARTWEKLSGVVGK